MTRRHNPGFLQFTVTNYAVALNIIVIHRQVQDTLPAATTDTQLRGHG